MSKDFVMISTEVPNVADLFDGIPNWSRIADYQEALKHAKTCQDIVVIDSLTNPDRMAILGLPGFMKRSPFDTVSKKFMDQIQTQ